MVQSHAYPAQAILLGAGRPWRGDTPAALQQVIARCRVLDWLVDAFAPAHCHFVGGYHFDDIAATYPTLAATCNDQWQSTGSVESLLCAPLREQDTFVSYADIVVRKEAVQAMQAQSADIVVAIDRHWKERYRNRGAEDMARAELVSVNDTQSEFAGFMLIRSKAMRVLMEAAGTLGQQLSRAHLVALVQWLAAKDLTVAYHDIGDDWAELNAPQDLARFVLGTKAETLERLEPLVTKSHICEQLRLTLGDWAADRDTQLQNIMQHFNGQRLIIRSSAAREDSWTESHAGAFTSILDIDAGDAAALAPAIDEVARSYGTVCGTNHILIQPFLSGMETSGVIFTRSLGYGAPYYVINYDDTSSRTDTVTSGGAAELKTFVLWREAADSAALPATLQPVLAAVQEIEALVGYDALDIEFAIDAAGQVYILQVRPLITHHERWVGSDAQVHSALHKAMQQFTAAQVTPARLRGKKALFGVMPDWNPAEIIGMRPTRFAESLYGLLVTDDSWAHQRREFGYHDVGDHPLMQRFAGYAYIDIRASFTSFLPARLNDALKAKLVDHYLAQLEANPHWHDKVEFHIVLHCLTLDFPERAAQLQEAGFTKAETDQLHAALASITLHASERYPQDYTDLEELGRSALLHKQVAPHETMAHIAALVAECKRYGVLPFAHLARNAFVVVSMLRSCVTRGIITQNALDDFLATVHTVAKQLTVDAISVREGSRAWEDFVAEYGHLRPGSYDITAPCYADDAERFLRPIVRTAKHHTPQPAALDWQAICDAFAPLGLALTADAMETWVRKAIEGREYAKFVFMRHTNAILHHARALGATHGLDTATLSHLDIKQWLAEPALTADALRSVAASNKLEHDLAMGIELPPLLCSTQDFAAFAREQHAANFIGSRSVQAAVTVIRESSRPSADLTGHIVLIPFADPGWDWIFGCGIAGFVTAWGGANSHMAIRAAEFDLPAAIGVGEEAWENYSMAHALVLDCAGRTIRIVA